MKSVIKLLGIIIVLSILGCAASPPSGTNQNIEGGSSSASVASVSGVDELDIAIREASDYLNENIPKGSKIVILNIESNSPDLSDYIIDELIANAVNDKIFTVVDRQQLDAIRSEQNFQLSGEVDDSDALEIGKLFGAQTIVSGAVNRLGTGYRIRIRALEVQTAQVQGQYNRNIALSQTMNSLLAGSGSATGSSTATASSTSAGATTAATTATGITAAAEPPITGTMVPGGSLSEKLAWLDRSADSNNTYILEVNADESIAPYVFDYKDAINITVVLRGDDTNRTIRLKSNGRMFTVNNNVTFILDNNITLQGHSGNNGSMVHVVGGTLKMRTGSAITGNTCTTSDGGGVYAYGTFEMSGGTISGNTAKEGGGVFVYNSPSNFTMSGGTISGNTAGKGGGISVFVNGIFTMRGGTITSNTSHEYGGGVYVNGIGRFTKSGGTITGYSSDQNNGNAVKDEAGNVIARRGHAVYFTFSPTRRKETTAGPGLSLSPGSETGWD